MIDILKPFGKLAKQNCFLCKGSGLLPKFDGTHDPCVCLPDGYEKTYAAIVIGKCLSDAFSKG